MRRFPEGDFETARITENHQKSNRDDRRETVFVLALVRLVPFLMHASPSHPTSYGTLRTYNIKSSEEDNLVEARRCLELKLWYRYVDYGFIVR
jgi:hypothetical protein